MALWSQIWAYGLQGQKIQLFQWQQAENLAAMMDEARAAA
jgi:hypothetical protein